VGKEKMLQAQAVELGRSPTREEIEVELARGTSTGKLKVGSSTTSEVSHSATGHDRRSPSIIVLEATCDRQMNERMSGMEESLKMIMQHLKIANMQGNVADTEVGRAASA
jgi:hypothetical protein